MYQRVSPLPAAHASFRRGRAANLSAHCSSIHCIRSMQLRCHFTVLYVCARAPLRHFLMPPSRLYVVFSSSLFVLILALTFARLLHSASVQFAWCVFFFSFIRVCPESCRAQVNYVSFDWLSGWICAARRVKVQLRARGIFIFGGYFKNAASSFPPANNTST